MDILISVSTILFLILCVFLIIIILLQSDKSAGMGILGGSSQSTFGSSTADIITKMTAIMVAVFMLGSLGISILQSYKERSIQKGLITEDSKTPGVIDKVDKSKEKIPDKSKEATGFDKKVDVKTKEAEKK